jgi:hypothetical protein
MQPDHATPRFRRLLRGAGSILDLFGTRDRTTSRRRGGLATDAEAIAGDWRRVGDDLRRAVATVGAGERACCSPEASARLLAHLGEQLEAHADRDGLTGPRRAVFLARGGHAPGDGCPSEPPSVPDPHAYWCGDPDEPCRCGVSD